MLLQTIFRLALALTRQRLRQSLHSEPFATLPEGICTQHNSAGLSKVITSRTLKRYYTGSNILVLNAPSFAWVDVSFCGRQEFICDFLF